MILGMLVAVGSIVFGCRVKQRIKEQQIEEGIHSIMNMEDKKLKYEMYVMMSRIANK